MPVNDPDVGIAFALVVGAGLSTCLGASVVFFPRLVKLASRRVLAASLGLSAGVMVYVSFVEILVKSKDSFAVTPGISEEYATLYSTLCVFGGAFIMLVSYVSFLQHCRSFLTYREQAIDFLVKIMTGHKHDHDIPIGQEVDEVQGHECFTCSPDPVGDLEDMHNQANSIIRRRHQSEDVVKYDADGNEENLFSGKTGNFKENGSEEKDGIVSGNEGDSPSVNSDHSNVKDEETSKAEARERKKLIKMGINTAVAIALHNFPEGLATFVATLDDPRVGAVLAIAIGIHNIPEGLCVALPVYYATGNRLKAFTWALLSGASEPLAALLGWAVLANSFSDQLYAVLFGFVAGMMIIISTRELLPTAHRYDPEDTVVTYSFIIGMGIMAASLVLFQL